MSLFPKFKIPSYTPATLATPATIATFRAESSRNSESSNPRDAQNPDFQAPDKTTASIAVDPSCDGDALGITATDVLRVFGGGLVVAENKPVICRYCDNHNVPDWRKGGSIVQRIWADGLGVSFLWASVGGGMKRWHFPSKGSPSIFTPWNDHKEPM